MLLLLHSAVALTPEQQVEDFETFWHEAEQHPALTLYTPRDELEAAKAATRAQLDVERDPIQFWGVLSQSAARIGCGHTRLLPTPEILEQLPTGTTHFPLDLVVVDGILHLDPRTPHTGRVVSIAGMNSDELLPKLRNMTNSDGLSTPFQDYRIDRLSRYLVSAVVGPQPSFHVQIERDGIVESMEVGDDDRQSPEFGEPAAEAAIERVPVGDGFIVRASFDSFDSKRSVRRRVTRPILRAVKDGAKGVVIDVRRNGGGAWTAAADLLSHFHPESWPTYSNRMTTRQVAEERGWKGELREDGLVDMGFGKRAMWHPREPQVEVPLIVLTSGYTFSTAADLAGFVRREEMGTIVGSPSGGSVRTQSSQGSRKGVLENSRLTYSFPLHRSDLADPEGVLKGGVGAIPHIEVHRTLDDLATGADPVLDTALALFE